jgi:hypothetical protein
VLDANIAVELFEKIPGRINLIFYLSKKENSIRFRYRNNNGIFFKRGNTVKKKCGSKENPRPGMALVEDPVGVVFSLKLRKKRALITHSYGG